MTLVMNQLLDSQLTDSEVEEDQINEPKETNEETTMVLWDWTPTLGLREEEQKKYKVQINNSYYKKICYKKVRR